MSSDDEDDRYGGYADSGKYDDDYGYEDEEAPQLQYDDPAPEVEGDGDQVDDDDLRNLDDQIYQEVLRQQQEKQKAQSQKNTLGDDIFDEYAHENLGDNFEDTPWVPPSLELVELLLFQSISHLLGMGISSRETLWRRKNKVAQD